MRAFSGSDAYHDMMEMILVSGEPNDQDHRGLVARRSPGHRRLTAGEIAGREGAAVKPPSAAAGGRWTGADDGQRRRILPPDRKAGHTSHGRARFPTANCAVLHRP